MKNLLFATTASVAFATGAMAGSTDITPVAPIIVAAPAMASDWSGFYVGGLVSFDSGTVEGNSSPASPVVASTGFGGFVGYNKQVNAMVFGGEVAYTVGDIAISGFPNSVYSERLDLKARVGFSFGRALVYGVVGYSFAEFSDVGAPFPSSGLNYGAGVDVMVSQRIFVGAEYLIRDLHGENGPDVVDGDLNSFTIRAGIKF